MRYSWCDSYISLVNNSTIFQMDDLHRELFEATCNNDITTIKHCLDTGTYIDISDMVNIMYVDIIDRS